jgi:hypothetical protein
MLVARSAFDVRGIMSGSETTYELVPDVDAGAQVDPHWLELRGESPLPSVYMPPAMAGAHARWLRVMAFVLIGVFVAATAAGICLTYGPPHRPF